MNVQNGFYIGLYSGFSANVSANVGGIIPVGGTVTNLRFYVQNGHVPGATGTVTFYVNGNPTALTCPTANVANATCSDTSHSVTVNAGDRLQVLVTANIGAPAGWTAVLTTP